jgi:transcription elongation GreA/GreB family factor
MATLLTTEQEYRAVRQAIQIFSTGRQRASFSIDGVNVTYQQGQMEFLERREKELAARLSRRNVRKRTQPDFSGSGGDY